MKVEDYTELTVDEVKAKLDSGDLSAGEVRQLEEKSGKSRKGVFEFLPEPDEEPQPRSSEPKGPEPGGIDSRLIEQRDAQREAEQSVAVAHHAEPASLDPKLAEIRDKTREQETQLAGRDLTQPPVRTRRQ